LRSRKAIFGIVQIRPSLPSFVSPDKLNLNWKGRLHAGDRSSSDVNHLVKARIGREKFVNRFREARALI